MIVKSLTWCSMTVVAVLAMALLSTAPVSAHSDDDHQQTQTQIQKDDGDNDKDDKKFTIKNPTIHVETGACVFLGDNEGTIGVDVTNPNGFKTTYKVVLDGKEKSTTVEAHQTEYIAFTELAIGNYTVDVTGWHDTMASGNATIKQCHEHELPTVDVDACGCADGHNGHLTLTISNTNDYAVTYTVRVNGYHKDVFVDAHSTNTVAFSHLKAGDYEITVSGDDCTHLCLHATVDQCPVQTQPGQGSGNPTPPTTTPAAPSAPAVTPVAPVATPATASQPAVLPDTSAADVAAPVAVVAKVQTPQTISMTSLVLVALGLPMIAAAAVLRRQQLAAKAE